MSRSRLESMLDAEMDKAKVLQWASVTYNCCQCLLSASLRQQCDLQVAHGHWEKAKLRDLALDTHEKLPSFGASKPRKEPRKQDTGSSPRKVVGFVHGRDLGMSWQITIAAV